MTVSEMQNLSANESGEDYDHREFVESNPSADGFERVPSGQANHDGTDLLLVGISRKSLMNRRWLT
jgi:hypothetical protein